MATDDEASPESGEQLPGGEHRPPPDIPAPGAPAPPGPYPRLIGRQLMTPTPPLAPGAAVRAYPQPIHPPTAPISPAQWADDPAGRHQWRWWDGFRWTDQVADDEVVTEDPLDS